MTLTIPTTPGISAVPTSPGSAAQLKPALDRHPGAAAPRTIKPTRLSTLETPGAQSSCFHDSEA